VCIKKHGKSHIILSDSDGRLQGKGVVSPVTDNHGGEFTPTRVKVSSDGKRMTVKLECSTVPQHLQKNPFDTPDALLAVTLSDPSITVDPIPVDYTDDDPCP